MSARNLEIDPKNQFVKAVRRIQWSIGLLLNFKNVLNRLLSQFIGNVHVLFLLALLQFINGITTSSWDWGRGRDEPSEVTRRTSSERTSRTGRRSWLVYRAVWLHRGLSSLWVSERSAVMIIKGVTLVWKVGGTNSGEENVAPFGTETRREPLAGSGRSPGRKRF